MEVILTQDVEKLGMKDEIVKVKAGYGRNFLIPRGHAILATNTTKKVLDENLKQRAVKEAKVKKGAEETAVKLKEVMLKIGAKAGENGKIFGSVTALQLADALKVMGHEVDRRHIKLSNENIKELGKYSATCRLHREVSATFDFEVVAE